MPELISKPSKGSEKSAAAKSVSSGLKSSRPSGGSKGGDTKRSGGKATSESPPKRRPRRRTRSSSDSQSSDSSSDSDSATSSSESSEVSKESPKKTVKPKADAERPKASGPSSESLHKSEPQQSAKTVERTPRDQSKKPLPSKENESKRNETVLKQVTSADNSSLAIGKSAVSAPTNVARDQVVSDVSGKHPPKTTKNDDVTVDRSTKDRSASPSALPPFTRILVEKLTRNVNKAHVTEIFSVWGKIHSVDMPPDRLHPEFSRSYAYVTYEDPSSAADAVNFMNGGQVDGEVVRVTEILPRSSLVVRGSANINDDKARDREREPAKRESGRPVDAAKTNKNETTTATRRLADTRERSRERGRSSDETDRRRERQREQDRIRDRERERERDRQRELSRDRSRQRGGDRTRRTRRGSSGSPFANRSGPSANRTRSPPAGSRYNRNSPPAARADAASTRRARSRSPISKPAAKPAPDAKAPNRRGREASSRSSSSSSSGSDSSNSSSSSSRSGSSSSSSSSSSRSRS